jgi:hypothetical protein
MTIAVDSVNFMLPPRVDADADADAGAGLPLPIGSRFVTPRRPVGTDLYL